MDFKDRIKSLREASNMSPSQLGAAMNKSEGAVRSWETGKAKPDAETIIKLAAFFKCSTDYLLGISDFKTLSAARGLEAEIESLSEEYRKTQLAIEDIHKEIQVLQKQREIREYQLHENERKLALLRARIGEKSHVLMSLKENL